MIQIFVNHLYSFKNHRKINKLNSHGWWIIDMYSNLPKEEQKQVKTEAEEGMRKIVLSTNICESSLTVPDVKYGE